MQISIAIMENGVEIPQKTKIKNYHTIQQFYYWIYIHKQEEILISKRYFLHIYYSITHNRQNMETAQMNLCGWLDKENIEYCSTTKKNDILHVSATWMELENIMLSKTS